MTMIPGLKSVSPSFLRNVMIPSIPNNTGVGLTKHDCLIKMKLEAFSMQAALPESLCSAICIHQVATSRNKLYF